MSREPASTGYQIDDVLNYLRKKLLPACGDDHHRRDNVEAWIRGLSHSTKSTILAADIAIDLEADALDPTVFIEIITAKPVNGTDPCSHFASILEEHEETERYACVSRLNGNAPPAYVRVLELTSFVQHFIKPGDGRNLTLDDIWEAWEDVQEDGDLSGIPRWWSGRGHRVWVLPKDEYDDLLRQADKQAPGTIFFDCLGIPYQKGSGKKREPYAVAVVYPDDHSLACEFVQPSSLDADWTSEVVFYASYGRLDGWGRTCSCSGNDRHCKERVHRRTKHLTAAFKIEDIGPSNRLPKSHERIMNEVLRRFGEFCGRTLE